MVEVLVKCIKYNWKDKRLAKRDIQSGLYVVGRQLKGVYHMCRLEVH